VIYKKTTLQIYRSHYGFFVETPMVQGHFLDLQDLPVRIRGALSCGIQRKLNGIQAMASVSLAQKKHADVDFWRVKWMILTYFENFEMFYPLVI